MEVGLRVIAGIAKGRRLLSVSGKGTRPITDRVKEALFDILGSDIEEATFLDLFAGTGSVGIEALSRGARHAVFVERAHKALQTIHKNLKLTGLGKNATVVRGDAFRYLKQYRGEPPFDFIYVAPPQYRDIWARVLKALDSHPILSPKGVIIVQIHPKEVHELALERLQLERERRYGSTLLRFYTLVNSESVAECIK